MPLDYGQTCNNIDQQIKETKKSIYNWIEGLIEDICPKLPDETLKKLAEDEAEGLYKDISGYFESVRLDNENMRKEADRQIEYLEDKIVDLQP